MTLRQNIQKALRSECRFDFLTLGGAVRTHTAYDPDLVAAKIELKKRGHSVRSAAPHVGRSFQWINLVLNGKATSRPVLEAIYNLPLRQPRLKTNQTT